MKKLELKLTEEEIREIRQLRKNVVEESEPFIFFRYLDRIKEIIVKSCEDLTEKEIEKVYVKVEKHMNELKSTRLINKIKKEFLEELPN